jgi:signal transduction histidine kinase
MKSVEDNNLEAIKDDSLASEGVFEVGNVTPFPGSLPSLGASEISDAQRFQSLKACMGDPVFQVAKDGTILQATCLDDWTLPLSVEGIVGKNLKDLLPTQIALQAMHHLEKVLRTEHVAVVHCPYNLPGRVREFQVRISPCGPDEVTVLIRDVTDRRTFEKEILEVSHRTQLRIGQDLHDGLGQHLTGITFLSKALENKLAARELPEAADAQEIARLVIQALAQTRNLARGLFPVELESGGLLPALKELATAMKTLYKLSCAVECEEGLTIVDRNLANHLFRLAQEAVNNAVKHGRAHTVLIQLRRHDEEQSVLSITDDGAGFEDLQEKSNGLGLRIMRYRAKKIGAHLTIQPARIGGTQVLCTFRNTSSGDENACEQSS